VYLAEDEERRYNLFDVALAISLFKLSNSHMLYHTNGLRAPEDALEHDCSVDLVEAVDHLCEAA
jgi:hypothetical protein